MTPTKEQIDEAVDHFELDIAAGRWDRSHDVVELETLISASKECQQLRERLGICGQERGRLANANIELRARIAELEQVKAGQDLMKQYDGTFKDLACEVKE